ncbi:ribonuclease HII [Aminipila butyrica]|uniref:Ribonuclease HII n=1 Tax=Aminipila butyrica TaxID=433296 RepID=A0A858BSJ3_9FIRM|nr:ribonuclease HII [Aminipila butyrica]QIB68873.1 ribonuclease HII [Aminipila butyrica]
MKREEREALLREKLQEMKKYEQDLYRSGLNLVAGVDEVGRGPLAGPVVAACAVLPADFDLLGVDDSKKLSEKKREELFDQIREKAMAYGIGMADHLVIDEINILEATKKAMAEAVANADESLKKQGLAGIQHLLIDALTLKEVSIPQTGIIKGDANSVSIAAASILAKVTRDRMMAEYSKIYPDYAFEKNKGYGTKAHYEGIEKAGICPIHRKTFLKKLLV